MAADALKAEGNKAFTEKRFDEAVAKFSEAIEIEPANHVLYSNRSGAYASKKDYEHALADATKTTEIKPDWSKGWGRKGAALHGTGELIGAIDAYEEALKLDPNNAQAKSGKTSVERAIEAEAKADGQDMGGDGGFGNMFNDPGMYGKLAANPKTAAFMRDPQFLAKLERLKKNPADMGAELGDQRILTAMGVLLGVDMSFGGPPEGGKAAGGGRDEDGDEDMPDLRPATSAPPSKKAPEPAPSAPEPEPVDEEALAQQKAKAAADEEKKLGTENYKKRQFDEAIAHYEKAWELHKDITYLTNLGAAKFEKKDYEGAIAACSTAVTEGREMLADFKLVAKAYGRMGSSYEKMGDLGLAIENYQRALTEHRTPDILTKLRAAEKAKVIADRNAYVDPAQAEAARELGNQKFKDAEWPAAVEAYSEMTRRAPDDPRGYSNRAACLIKLLSFPAAVTDCDEAIRRDPAFVRAYLRKAQALFAMREYSRCIDVCAEAHEHDGEGRNAREIDAQQQKALSAQFTAQEGETEEQTSERIQRDPEIMSILQDPVMQSILQQAKGDPAALQNHMQNPGIRTKIQKLIAAGVIKLGR